MKLKNWCTMDPEWLKFNLNVKDDTLIETYFYYLERLCFHMSGVTQTETTRPLIQSAEIKVVNKLATDAKYKNIITIMHEIAAKHKNFEVIRHFNWLKENTKLGDTYEC